jgi:hypothetical protein
VGRLLRGYDPRKVPFCVPPMTVGKVQPFRAGRMEASKHGFPEGSLFPACCGACMQLGWVSLNFFCLFFISATPTQTKLAVQSVGLVRFGQTVSQSVSQEFQG